MARINGIYLALASICLLVLCNVAVAQDSTTDASVSSTIAGPIVPVSCQDATPATVNGTLLLGTWYEAARKPVGGGNNTEQCVQMIIDYNNNTVLVAITFSLDPTALWLNQTITNSIAYNNSAGGANPEVFTAIFNVTSGGVNTTFKILDTDYSSYALICGYPTMESPAATTTVAPSSTTVSGSSTTAPSSTDAPSSTTSAPVNLTPAGAFIITRERQINATMLANLTANALVNYSDFKNISTVTQSSQCYTSGAATTVPMLAMILAIVYSALKFVN